MKKCISIMEDNPVIDTSEVDERDYVVNIEKALKSSKKFWKTVELGKEKWLDEDDGTRDIARSNMQITVEELVRSIPKSLKKQIPEIDWEDLRNFRNFIVHNYDNVVWSTMWTVSQEKMKVADLACKKLLEVLGENR